MIDPFGRHITYLRVSVTDRCDFRCVYCMPEHMEFLPRGELLTLEQLYAERDPLYREVADIIVDTGRQSLGSLAHQLERKLQQFKSSTMYCEDSPTRTG